MNSHEWNRAAWDRAVGEGANPYTTVVSPEEVAAARQGTWSVYLSDCKPVPLSWFPSLRGIKILCLASGGGQQRRAGKALYGTEFTNPDFMQIAAAYQIDGYRVGSEEQCADAVAAAIAARRPALIEAMIDPISYPTTPPPTTV